MTAERVKEAQQRSCYHLHLRRILHGETLIWSENWMCMDCPAMFDLSQIQPLATVEDKDTAQ